MNISEWLDKKEAEGIDLSQIELPDDLLYDASPDEVVFFSGGATLQHPLLEKSPFFYRRALRALVLLQGPGQEAGIHATGMEWRFFTKNKDLALKTAKSHIE